MWEGEGLGDGRGLGEEGFGFVGVRVWARVCVRACACARVGVCVRARACARVRACVRARTRACVCGCMRARACVRACVCALSKPVPWCARVRVRACVCDTHTPACGGGASASRAPCFGRLRPAGGTGSGP